MNRILLVLAFVLSSTILFAQKTYFVYLQSESKQGFFVKIDKSILNSTSSGYLIIPDLRDSSYVFEIGIQGKELNKQFEIGINKKDRGYLITNDKSSDWTLFDLQDLKMVKPYIPAVANQKTEVVIEKVENNPFNDLLSKAVGDSTIKERTVFVKKEEKKVQPQSQQVAAVPTVVKETEKKEVPRELIVVDTVKKEQGNVVVKTENMVKTETKPVAVIAQETNSVLKENESLGNEKNDNPIGSGQNDAGMNQRSTVKYRSESSTTEGLGLVYTDTYQNGKTDTIRILIPSEIRSVETATKDKPKEKDLKFLDIVSDSSSGIAVDAESGKRVPEKKETVKSKKVEKPAAVNESEKKENVVAGSKTNCAANATQDDFLELRKRMAAEKDDDAMLDQARQYFKLKCFTSAQVKNLGSLFLYDLGRFQFFNLAYRHVSDTDNFSKLESELTDDYFIERFRTLLKNQ